LGEFVRFSPFGPNLQNDKYPSRTAAFASTPNVPGENRTVQDLKQNIQRCAADLVFNLDEVGISDWEDRKTTTKTKTVIVPATMRGQTIHHEISRTVKHISVIACVSAAEESLTPYIITLQVPTSVQERLKKEGVRFSTDFVLRSNPSPYINTESFIDYIRTVFLPNLAELRTLDAFTEETGVLCY
jgi:hypothetical protein